MSETQETAKRIYNEMNTAMETALTKVAQRFNADDFIVWAPEEDQE